VANRTRVSVRVKVWLSSGRSYHEDLAVVQRMIEKGRLEWIEEGVSAAHIAPPTKHEYGDFSGIGDGRHLASIPSGGGPLVMQLWPPLR